jgi:hypothetical protein
MKYPFWPTLAVAAALTLPGCGRAKVALGAAPPTPVAKPVSGTRTLETSRLGEAVDKYAREQNPENDAAVRQAMAKLDSEIAGLEELIANRHGKQREDAGAKMRNFIAYRSAETTRFAAVQAGVPLAPPDPSDAGAGPEKIEGATTATATATTTGSAVEEAARNAIKEAAH